MKKRVVMLALSSLLSVQAAAQSGTQATPKPPAPAPVPAPAAPTVKVSSDGQWEYLVISFGKTYFSSATDIAAKQNGESKLMIFGPLGGVLANEALDTQKQVDTLGRYGWELVTVLGAIGGDQQWVFKRRYDPARAASEAAQIKKEGNELAAARAKAQQEAAARPVTPPPAAPTELVELDSREAEAKRTAANQALRANAESKLRIPGWSFAELNTSGLSSYTSSYAAKITSSGVATVMLDVTERVLSGNTYRRSAAEAAIEEYVKALAAQGRTISKASYDMCMDGGEAVKIGASLKFNNEWRQAVYATTTYCLK